MEVLKLKAITGHPQLMSSRLELSSPPCDKNRMHKTRYALLMLMLAMWTDYSFGMQANVITTVAGECGAHSGTRHHRSIQATLRSVWVRSCAF